MNLDSNEVRVYSLDTPDRIDPRHVRPWLVIPPAHQQVSAAICGETQRTHVAHLGVIIDDVLFEASTTSAHPLPAPVAGIWYIVPFAVGLVALQRRDLLIPFDFVCDGTSPDEPIIGSRKLARPSLWPRTE